VLARFRAHLTFANAVSVLALFIALGGGAYALSLPKNSVGARQLKKNAVTSVKIHSGAVTAAKVRAHSLLARNFASGQLPIGPRGPRGATGAQGVAGSAVAYGAFAGGSTGVTINGPVKNLSAANISRAGAGAYCFSGLSFTPKNIVATLDSSFTSGIVTSSLTGFGPCPVGTQSEVKIFTAAGAPMDASFSVLFN
jgi:hypothetical protein